MKNTMLLCTMLAALTTSMGAHAADTAELKVKGSVQPSACTLTLSADGVVDMGRIPTSRLDLIRSTYLGSKLVPLNISCPTGAAKLALKFQDNRTSSVVAGLIRTIDNGLPDSQAFGLGTFDGKKIGIYTLEIVEGFQVTKADGTTAKLYSSTSSNGTGWYAGQGSDYHMVTRGLESWGSSQVSPEPVAVRSLSSKLLVRVIIDELRNLSTKNDIPLDGSATLEMVYL